MNPNIRKVAGVSVLLFAALLGPWAIWRQRQIDVGEKAFAKYGCATCHANGGGPSLRDATKRHDDALLVRFIENPANVYSERNNQTLNEGWMQMPALHVSHEEARAIVRFLDNQ